MAKDLLTPTKLANMEKTTAVGGGLYVVVNGNSKSYGLRKTFKGKQLNMMLVGSVEDLTPSQARAKLDAYIALIKKGVNPWDDKARLKAEGDNPAPKVSDLLDRYYEKKVEPERHEFDVGKKWKARINKAMGQLDKIRKGIGKVLVTDVNLKMIRNQFPELENSLAKSTDEVRRYLQRVFDYAVVLEMRETNPATQSLLKGLKPEGYHKRENRASLSYRDAPRFVAELKGRKNKGLGKEGKDLVTVPATLFLIYTGVRTEEVREARWGEINEEKELWEVPREHRKNGRTKSEIRAIPISEEMFAVLNGQKRKTNALGQDDFIFPGGGDDGGLGRGTLLRRIKDTVKELGWDFAVTSHGFRSTLNTWTKVQDPPYHPNIVKAQFDHLSKMSDDERDWLRASMADKHYSNSDIDPTIEGEMGRRAMTKKYNKYLNSYKAPEIAEIADTTIAPTHQEESITL
jgi:integrase